MPVFTVSEEERIEAFAQIMNWVGQKLDYLTTNPIEYDDNVGLANRLIIINEINQAIILAEVLFYSLYPGAPALP